VTPGKGKYKYVKDPIATPLILLYVDVKDCGAFEVLGI
jgi:hypothetical protein